MKTFNVSITEINYGAVIIEANNKKEAEDAAEAAYFNGDVHWTGSEISEMTIIEEAKQF